MNNPLDPSLRDLNDCGCCAGTSPQTPATIDNRPGLPSICFRAGVHSQFKDTLLTGLSSRDHSALRGLRTRENEDFTIALLDAFASMADVLTFYSERIANESYLRTATERRSVLELARAIGYELAPGVAAGVMLSFTIEGATGAPGTALIPKGTKVQSIPGPEEKPQTFETSLDFTGHASWNELRPRKTRPQELSTSADFLFLQGTATNLKPGDVLVLATASDAVAKRVRLVTLDRERNITRVDFAQTPAPVPPYRPPVRRNPNLNLGVGPANSALWQDFFGGNTAVSGSVGQAALYYGGWRGNQIVEHFQRPTPAPPLGLWEGVFVVRSRVGFFGHNAPRQETLPKPENNRSGSSIKKDPLAQPWDGTNARSIWENSQGIPYKSDDNAELPEVFLERVVAEVTEESWAVFDNAAAPLRPFRVTAVTEVSQADYGLSGKSSALVLLDHLGLPLSKTRPPEFKTRTTTAYVQSERLELAEIPVFDAIVAGQSELPLSQLDFQLQKGQTLALSGEMTNPANVRGTELVEISELRHGDRITTLTFRAGLKNGYVRSTVTLNANVVPATHGETTQEVLGSGDAAQPFQRFTLKQKPLTYAFPPDAAQPVSSLQIWVDDAKWHETATFYESGPRDRVYIVRRADDGTTTVQFGDGRRGARLPSGRENVRAVYRKGIGRDGLVKAEQISLMLTQPLGVKGVNNLLAAQGAEDPQVLDDARINAPRTVLTLDRIVSLQDYEDFARDFPGVDKAHAVWTWAGQTRGVLLTLLGPNGLSINETGQPSEPLKTALTRQGIARVPVRIVSRPPSLFNISGIVRVDDDRVPSIVETAIGMAMLDAFSFAARQFGRGIHISEVIALIQNVPGVLFVDLKGFQKTSLVAGVASNEDAVNGYLNAHQPVNGVDALLAEPAELLILDESSLPQLEVKSL